MCMCVHILVYGCFLLNLAIVLSFLSVLGARSLCGIPMRKTPSTNAQCAPCATATLAVTSPVALIAAVTTASHFPTRSQSPNTTKWVEQAADGV